MVCVILPEMSLLVYIYMTTGGQERGIEGGMEGGGREEEGRRKGGRVRVRVRVKVLPKFRNCILVAGAH